MQKYNWNKERIGIFELLHTQGGDVDNTTSTIKTDAIASTLFSYKVRISTGY